MRFLKLNFGSALFGGLGIDMAEAKKNSNSILWWSLSDISSRTHQPLKLLTMCWEANVTSITVFVWKIGVLPMLHVIRPIAWIMSDSAFSLLSLT